MHNHVILLAVAGALALVMFAGAAYEHRAASPRRRRRLQEPAMVRRSLRAAIAHEGRRQARAQRRQGR